MKTPDRCSSRTFCAPRRPVAIDPRDRGRFPFLAGVVLALPGVILEDDGTGTRVRVLPDGSLEEVLPGGHVRPSGWNGEPAATARRRSSSPR